MLDDDDDGHRVFSACAEVVPARVHDRDQTNRILRVHGGSSRPRA